MCLISYHYKKEVNILSCITTYRGICMDPLDATPDQIDEQDIAHALSLLCRANGHFPHFYSVAQHSLNCMREAVVRGYSTRVQLGCLLHDASEAYLSDITRPIKPHLTGYFEIEEKLQEQIFNKWITPALTEEERKLIFEIDDAMLYHEFFKLTGKALFETAPTLTSSPTLCFVDFGEIENKFLTSLYRLAHA